MLHCKQFNSDKLKTSVYLVLPCFVEMVENLKHAQRKLEEITNAKDSEVKCLQNLVCPAYPFCIIIFHHSSLRVWLKTKIFSSVYTNVYWLVKNQKIFVMRCSWMRKVKKLDVSTRSYKRYWNSKTRWCRWWTRFESAHINAGCFNFLIL